MTYTDPATNAAVTKNFLEPGGIYKGATGGLDLFSLGLALVLGTAGLPHILVRFYTVPSARVARTSIIWAMALIGTVLYSYNVPGLGRGHHCRT